MQVVAKCGAQWAMCLLYISPAMRQRPRKARSTLNRHRLFWTFVIALTIAGVVVALRFLMLQSWLGHVPSELPWLAFALISIAIGALVGRIFFYPEANRQTAPAGSASTLTHRGPLLARLSPREQEVALAIGEGLTNGEIAEKLGVSAHTIKTHTSNIYEKTSLRNRAALSSALSKTNGALPQMGDASAKAKKTDKSPNRAIGDARSAS